MIDPSDYYNHTETFSTYRFSRSSSKNFGSLTYDFYAEYSKSDGILTRWYQRIVDSAGEEVGLVNVVRIGGNQSLLIILAIAGAVVITTVAVLVYMKKK